MYRIHGFEPGEVVPSTELVMTHMHPDDREAAYIMRGRAVDNGEPFTFPHRIYTADRRLRIVIAAGHTELVEEAARLVGHLLDVTDLRHDAVEAEVDQAVADFQVHRAVIEQAKGVLMQLYSVDADTAWTMLRAYSQTHNRRLRAIAESVVNAATRDATPSKEARGAIHDVLKSLVGTDRH